MKKLFAVLLTAVLAGGLAGCTPKVETTTVTQTKADFSQTETSTSTEMPTAAQTLSTAVPTSPAVSQDTGPYWPTAEWRTATPEQQNMDAATLNQITSYVKNSTPGVDSVVVVRGGYIVFENYFSVIWDKDTAHNIYSCTKSVMGSLVGITIKQGYIKSLNDKMVDYFPNRSIQNMDDRKKNITLLNLMTMKGGFDWNEWQYAYTDPRNIYIQAMSSPDKVQFVLDRPMSTDPGTVWAYNGGFSEIFSQIVTDRTKMSTLDFANKNLFGPLGITNVRWSQDSHGIYNAGGGLSMTPRNMAKFGWLILNKGVWEGKQVIPADFVAESVKTQTTFSANSGYGYESWWTVPLDGFYYAAGIYGQRIYVIDKQDMVVVVTATLAEDGTTESKVRRIAQFAISACK